MEKNAKTYHKLKKGEKMRQDVEEYAKIVTRYTPVYELLEKANDVNELKFLLSIARKNKKQFIMSEQLKERALEEFKFFPKEKIKTILVAKKLNLGYVASVTVKNWLKETL